MVVHKACVEKAKDMQGKLCYVIDFLKIFVVVCISYPKLLCHESFVILSFFFSFMGWHVLPSHASTEACLTGWPSAQPQG